MALWWYSPPLGLSAGGADHFPLLSHHGCESLWLPFLLGMWKILYQLFEDICEPELDSS